MNQNELQELLSPFSSGAEVNTDEWDTTEREVFNVIKRLAREHPTMRRVSMELRITAYEPLVAEGSTKDNIKFQRYANGPIKWRQLGKIHCYPFILPKLFKLIFPGE